MNLKQALKITLLIVILAEEIKSVGKKVGEEISITNQNHLLKESLKVPFGT